MKALITIELDYPNQIYDLYETKELRLYFSKEGFYIWEGGFEIKPMPKKMKHKDEIDYEYGYIDGRNELIDEMLGETE